MNPQPRLSQFRTAPQAIPPKPTWAVDPELKHPTPTTPHDYTTLVARHDLQEEPEGVPVGVMVGIAFGVGVCWGVLGTLIWIKFL